MRKKPGSTIVVSIPNGSISNLSDSIHPSRPNFDAAYAEQNACPVIPAVEEIVMMWPTALLAHDGQHGPGDVHRAAEVRLELLLELLRRQLLEEACEEVPGVVDQHVDPAETVEGGLHRRFRRRGARDVQFHDEQVVGLANRVGHGVGIAAGRDDRVAGGERRLGDVDAHPATRTSDRTTPSCPILGSPSRHASGIGRP